MKVNKVLLYLGLPLLTGIVLLMIYNHRRSLKKNDDGRAFLNSLQSMEQFDRFAGAPLDSSYANISSIKVVYDLRRKQIFYINSHLYRLHYDFCKEVLGYRFGLSVFNLSNYGSRRDYYLANLNYLKKDRLFALEFSASDEIDSLQIVDMFRKVSESSFTGARLRLLLNNSNTIAKFSEGSRLPVCGIGLLNRGMSYQMIQSGSCSGRLVLCEDLKKEYLSVRPGDLLVVKGSPVDIPLCGAIISDQYQTPLSHVQVLSHNKKIPSAFLAGAFQNPRLLALSGKNVRLTVKADTLLTEPGSAASPSFVPRPAVRLPLNDGRRGLITLEDCRGLSNADIGTKAKGLSDLNQIANGQPGLFRIPEGAFVIPFYYFREHISRAGIGSYMDSLKVAGFADQRNTDRILRKIRQLIEDTPLNADLEKEVQRQIIKNNCGGSYRFRSSSNAEDLAEFNGAGLYDSKTGIIGHKKRTVGRAIRKVWARLFNYRAYRERRWANIDERTASMSILVHKNFPGEEINGVAITKNIYRADYPGIVINAQKGDVPTVNPPEGTMCEQLILTENRLMNPFSHRLSAKYICYSSLQPGRPLLNAEQLNKVQKCVDAIREFYADRHLDWDIEFKFDNGDFFVKQVRPYR